MDEKKAKPNFNKNDFNQEYFLRDLMKLFNENSEGNNKFPLR